MIPDEPAGGTKASAAGKNVAREGLIVGRAVVAGDRLSLAELARRIQKLEVAQAALTEQIAELAGKQAAGLRALESAVIRLEELVRSTLGAAAPSHEPRTPSDPLESQ